MDSFKDHSRARSFYRATQLIWYILCTVEVLLIFRFFLRAIKANPASRFASFIYETSSVFILPFASLSGFDTSKDMIFEWPTLLAMLFYYVTACAAIKILERSGKNQTAKKHSEQDN